MKGKEWKDFWEVELGVSYIPWNKLSADTDFELLEEGGMFDEETMPLWMKGNHFLPAYFIIYSLWYIIATWNVYFFNFYFSLLCDLLT